jgi:death-on-curing protein
MTLYLSRDDVHEMHFYLINRSGGSFGVRDGGALESAVAQPAMTFGERDLYPTLAEKAAALAFSLVMNHPFVDGNKRIGHYAMETFLMMNDHEIIAPRDEQEHTILKLASGAMEREEFAAWVRNHIQPLQ